MANHLDTQDLAPSPRIALVLGATGGIGGAVARALLARGWQVRSMVRDVATARRSRPELAQIEWQPGDAMRADDVLAAAQGVSVIFHGLNPPRYQKWRELAIPMLAHSIAAARSSRARLIFPGNIYNFGPDAGTVLSETSPQHPITRKGAVRVEMEQMLSDAARSGVRSVVVRAGDFFGGHGPSSWFSTSMVKPGQPLRSVTSPAAPGVGHAWAYLPDLAETIARLVEVEATLAPFDVFHFGGHWTERGDELALAVRRASGNPKLQIKSLPWPVLRLLSPFIGLLREMTEMRYLWKQPLRLDNRKLVAKLGAEPHTPLDEAVRRSLIELGCLAQPDATAQAGPTRQQLSSSAGSRS